jgi:Tfp pilus assembly protein PilV
MHINSDLEFVLIGGFVVLVVLLGVAGVVRTLRKRKTAA